MKTFPSALLVLGLVTNVFAADWPQWFGPNRDGHSPEKGLLKQWPKQGPALAWTFKDTGLGYSSPAVVGDKLYILGARGNDSYLFCLDVKNGMELWKVKVGPKFDFNANQWGGGPRATPTVAGGFVYAQGGNGDLVCVKADKGTEVWRKHLVKDLKGEMNTVGGGHATLGWGYSTSPLVDGGKVICFPGGPGGALAALDPANGGVLWRSKDLKEQASYSSPVVAEIGGVRQYLVLHNGGVTGIAAKNGEVLWNWEKQYSSFVIPTLLHENGSIYVTAGYNPSTCDLLQVTAGAKFNVRKTYNRKNSLVMKSLSNGPVLVGKHVYGYSDKLGWVCQELATGKEMWTDEGVKAGSVVVADGHLYCYGEDNGIVALVEPSKDGWKEKSRFSLPEKTKLKAPSGRNWTPPVIANGHLFIRDQELLFCYKIK